MNKFILRIFWFILPILIIAYPLDLLISHNLKKQNDKEGESEIWNDIYAGRASCDIAVYGSSRASSHINPKILEDSLQKSVYNFGIVAQFFDLQYARHSEFLKYNDKPKIIILSLDTFSLIKRTDLYMPEQFLPYMLFNERVRKQLSGYDEFSEADYYLPLARYAGKTQSLNRTLRNVFKSEEDAHKRKYKGYYGITSEWNDELDRINHIREKHKMFLDPTVVALFERFINECKNSGIDLVFVYTPEYIENRQYIGNRDEIMEIYRQFSIKYDLLFLDYSNDELCFRKENFFDSVHLTGKSVDIFTAKLAADLKKLLR